MMDPSPSEATTVIDTRIRLSAHDSFSFACGPHVPCFTECCGKLDLLLTPYDVLRLRKRLGMSPSDFLDHYAVIRSRTSHGFPEVLMKMDPDQGKRCPFVTPDGCTVYEDRPGACRIYPLGRASTRHPLDGTSREFYFTVREAHCRGFEQPTPWKVREWLEDQGMEEYNRVNDLLMELYVRKSRSPKAPIGEKHFQMFLTACYHLDRFREFIFRTSFLEKFRVEPELLEGLRTDDTKLLEFAFRWLRFAFFSDPVIEILSA